MKTKHQRVLETLRQGKEVILARKRVVMKEGQLFAKGYSEERDDILIPFRVTDEMFAHFCEEVDEAVLS